MRPRSNVWFSPSNQPARNPCSEIRRRMTYPLAVLTCRYRTVGRTQTGVGAIGVGATQQRRPADARAGTATLRGVHGAPTSPAWHSLEVSSFRTRETCCSSEAERACCSQRASSSQHPGRSRGCSGLEAATLPHRRIPSSDARPRAAAPRSKRHSLRLLCSLAAGAGEGVVDG
jgi:hypothetical protein